MRVWDIDPGYLNRQSLLGEHRELHAVVVVTTGLKKGYSRHPEVLRWAGRGWALRQRHRLLASEMSLRGYAERTPVRTRSHPGEWPETYVDDPGAQFRILAGKYAHAEHGRIPLPKNASELWSHHKYSVLARDRRLYERIGREVSGQPSGRLFSELALLLVETLRRPPTPGGVKDAVSHMWGHVSHLAGPGGGFDPLSRPPALMLAEVRRRALTSAEPYLVNSTALGELAAWLRG